MSLSGFRRYHDYQILYEFLIFTKMFSPVQFEIECIVSISSQYI